MDLVARLKRRDIDAFEELVLKFERKIYNTSLRMLSDPELSYDATQEVFIKIFRSISSFKEESQLSTWIYRITFNTCLDIKAREDRVKVLSFTGETEDGERAEYIDLVKDDSPTPEEAALSKEHSQLIKDAISSLPKDQMEIIMMRDVEGFSYKEISDRLNLSEGTVKSRINRARSKLQELLFDQRNFSPDEPSKKQEIKEGG